jgi:hypothetical protein
MDWTNREAWEIRGLTPQKVRKSDVDPITLTIRDFEERATTTHPP